MVTNNVTVYQFEVGLDEVFADEVIFIFYIYIYLYFCLSFF